MSPVPEMTATISEVTNLRVACVNSGDVAALIAAASPAGLRAQRLGAAQAALPRLSLADGDRTT